MNIRRPSDWAKCNNQDYLGHFRQDKFLDQGHNDDSWGSDKSWSPPGPIGKSLRPVKPDVQPETGASRVDFKNKSIGPNTKAGLKSIRNAFGSD